MRVVDTVLQEPVDTERVGAVALLLVALPPQDVVHDAAARRVREKHVPLRRNREPATNTRGRKDSRGEMVSGLFVWKCHFASEQRDESTTWKTSQQCRFLECYN